MTRTQIDDRKAAATIRLTYAYANTYDVASKVALNGRGIKPYGNGNYSVTEGALAKLRMQHTVECDF